MRKVKLFNIAEIASGNGAPQNKEIFKDEGIPFVRAGSLDFLVKGESIDKCEKIREEDAAKLKLRLFPAKSILFAKSGMSAKMGRIYMLEEDAFVVNHLAVIIPNRNEVNPLYLKYFFQKNSPTTLIRDDAYPSIRISDISDWIIELPNLNNQNKLSSVLLQAEKLIQDRKRSISILDKLVKSVFLEMFGDPILNSNDFPMVKLEKLGKWMSGGTPPKSKQQYYDGDIPWYSSGELNNVFISDSKERINESAIKETSAKLVMKDSLLIGMYDTAALKSSITKVDSSCNQAIAFCKLNQDRCDTLYVYSAIQIGRKFHLYKRRGGRQRNLNLKMIKGLEIPLPPLARQIDFSNIFSKIIIEKRKLEKSLADSEQLFKSLLQKAFRGELEFVEENVELQTSLNTINWYESQLSLLKATQTIAEQQRQIEKVLSEPLKNIKAVQETIRKMNLPALEAIKSFQNTLNSLKIPALDAIKTIEQFQIVKDSSAQLGIADEFKIPAFEEYQEEKRLKEIEEELSRENDPILKYISETQAGKITFANYNVNMPRFIHEEFKGQEFTFEEIINRLGDNYGLVNINEENVKKELVRSFKVFIRTEFNESAFTFNGLAKKLEEKLFNPSFELLHEFIIQELQSGKEIKQAYFPGVMNTEYPEHYKQLKYSESPFRLYLIHTNGNSKN